MSLSWEIMILGLIVWFTNLFLIGVTVYWAVKHAMKDKEK